MLAVQPTPFWHRRPVLAAYWNVSPWGDIHAPLMDLQLVDSPLGFLSDEPVATVALAGSPAGSYGLLGHTSLRDDVQSRFSWLMGWACCRFTPC